MKTLANATGKNGTSGQKYGTFIGLKEHKYEKIIKNPKKNPLAPKANVQNRIIHRKYFTAELNS